MEKLEMHSPDLTQRNIDAITELFPTVVTETVDADGKPARAVDFDALRQELSDHVVEGPQERYQLDWPGKRAATFAANAPIAKTLRPVREQSVDFDATKNLFIEGDNLEVLKLLQEPYLGKVKLIYIDPPYNTGGDFIYDDDFADTTHEYLSKSGQVDADGQRLVANSEANGRFHSDWLSMMYPRLKLSRNLLKDDGVIFISIDDHEVDNLRKLCDEVFGAQNFVAQIIWQKVYTIKNSARQFSEDHDYIVVYARDAERWKPNLLPRSAEQDAAYTNPDSDPRGPWKATPVQARNYYSKGVYPIETPTGRIIDGPPRGTYWRYSRETFDSLIADNRVWWGKDGTGVPAIKRFLSEVSPGRVPQTLWTYKEVGSTQDAKAQLLKYVPFEFTNNVFNSVKPVKLIQRIISISTHANSSDIVLDFFSGSGTTAHAALVQNVADGGNRRFIAVQIHEPLRTPELGFDSILGMSLTRFRNVASEVASELDLHGSHDLGFRLLRIDSTSVADVFHAPGDTEQNSLTALCPSVKPDRTSLDLLFQVLINSGIELSSAVDRIELDDHEVLIVEGGAIVACFDEIQSERLFRLIAELRPLGAVFRDSGFVSDAARINAEQIFREVSPETEVRAI